MKYLSLLIVALTLTCTGLSASLVKDQPFENDRMFATSDALFVVSSYENEDAITAYSYNGIRLWNAPFHAKILSWRMVDNYIFVFSKHRLGTRTYVTCLCALTGELVWQRP